MTGPEQHAATVGHDLFKVRAELESGDALAALGRIQDELVALAGRADELERARGVAEQERDEESTDAIAESAAWLDAVGEAFPDFDFSGCYDHDDLRTHLIGQAGSLRERAEAAEARADELQRERDKYEGLYEGAVADQTALEQARREADQLRAALRGFVEFCETLAAEEDNPIFALYEQGRAALAGVQAEKQT